MTRSTTYDARLKRLAKGRWGYSGGDDLVSVCGHLVPDEDPVIDWASAQGGSLGRLNLAEVVERLSRDIELGLDDERFGVGEIVGPAFDRRAGGPSVRDVVGSTVGDILGAVAVKAAGLD